MLYVDTENNAYVVHTVVISYKHPYIYHHVYAERAKVNPDLLPAMKHARACVLYHASTGASGLYGAIEPDNIVDGTAVYDANTGMWQIMPATDAVVAASAVSLLPKYATEDDIDLNKAVFINRAHFGKPPITAVLDFIEYSGRVILITDGGEVTDEFKQLYREAYDELFNPEVFDIRARVSIEMSDLYAVGHVKCGCTKAYVQIYKHVSVTDPRCAFQTYDCADFIIHYRRRGDEFVGFIETVDGNKFGLRANESVYSAIEIDNMTFNQIISELKK